MASFDILVIGGGVAGLTASVEAVTLGKKTALLEKLPMFGGQIANVEMVEGVDVREPGMMLAMNLMQQSMERGVETITAEVSAIASVDGKFLVGAPDGGYKAGSVIVASGGSLRSLRVPGEDKFIGRGVSQCASCDGPLFQGDDVIVVGGGDAAAQEALSLSDVCKSVTMICRSGLRARPHYVGRIEANKAISVMSNHVVSEILGEGGVSGVRVRNLENDTEPVIACTGVFPFIGSEPNSAFMADCVVLENGYVVTDDRFESSVPGIFAVGAVRKGYSGQLADALLEGRSAAAAACVD
jgi:thioredoxin reductase (NADPH)